jgi:predicted acyltransferase
MLDVRGYRKWAFPLAVVGMNSIAAYLVAHLWERFLVDSFRIHLGTHFFQGLGGGLEPLLRGSAVLLGYWLLLFWMYRRKIFLRV